MKKTIMLMSIFVLFGCADTSSKIDSNSSIEKNGYKYYPFKSAILTYKQENNEAFYKKVKAWDEWGRKISYFEEFGNKKTAKTHLRSHITKIIRDGSVLYEFDYYKKLVKKRRDSIRFLQILSGEDLRKYYVDNPEVVMHTKKTDKTDVVGGVECNIWEGRWVRACRYRDIITLKEEKKTQTGKWVVVEEVSSAQFNISIDKKMFQVPKEYKVKVSSTFKTLAELEEYAKSYNTRRDINMSVNIIKDNYKKIMDARKAYFKMLKGKEQ